jgi:putative transposase
VGIDVGVTTFATFSDGTEIQNPRIYQNAQAELRRAQRKVSRRKKGSNRRRKAVVQLQKIHARIVSQRSDFLHKHSTAVVRKYGTIVVEALNVAAMSRSTLAKQILDCSGSEFFRMLKYKRQMLVGESKKSTPDTPVNNVPNVDSFPRTIGRPKRISLAPPAAIPTMQTTTEQ